jgi:hypothetical protein
MVEVGADRLHDRVGAARAQRIPDPLMLGQGRLHPGRIDVGSAAVQQVHGAHAQLPFPQRAVQRGDDLVPGRGDDSEMKIAIGLHVRNDVVRLHGGAHGVQVAFQYRPQGRGRLVGQDLAGRERLDQAPGLHHVGHLVHGDRQNQGPALGQQPDQPLTLQPEQGFADRGAGGAHRPGELTLGQQVMRGEPAGQDLAFDVRIGTIGGAHRGERPGRKCLCRIHDVSMLHASPIRPRVFRR